MPTNEEQRIAQFFNIVQSQKDFAYDVETTGLDWKTKVVIGYSVSDGNEGVYIPVRHTGGGNIKYVDTFEKLLAQKIDQHPAKIIGHNLKFDAHFSENHGIKLGDRLCDTMTREALINEHRISYALDACTKHYPNIRQKHGQELYQHIAQLTGCKPNRSAMGNYHFLSGDDPLAVEYAEVDTISAKQMRDKQDDKILEDNIGLVENLEQHLTYVLQKMERKGIAVDLHEFDIVEKKVNDLSLAAHAVLPLKDDLGPINPRSNKDIQEYFEMCEIDDWPITDIGNPSFQKDYLETHPEGLMIVEARKYDHLISSFIDPFMGYVHNGRIHTTFNQTRNEFGKGVGYGRLSCNGPNLQQVPKRDKFLGSIYRRIFIPDSNYVFVEYDHSQAEPRLYAHYSGEPVLVRGYSSVPFVDMHTIASELMGLTAKLGQEEGRKIAKNLNLGILYTMGAEKLSKKLKIPYEEAKKIIKQWYSIFRFVSGFSRLAQERASERGFVHTILGRRARFPDSRWAYRAANRVIQGSAADILKWKLVEIDRWIRENHLEDYVHMLVNIHDAILFQVHKDAIDEIPNLKDVFISVQGPPFNLKVPFDAEYHVGDNWAEASYGKK